MSGYSAGMFPVCDPHDVDCSQSMPHQDTVLLIYVFSIFGLVLVLMICSFYACHLYAQRSERLRLLNAPPPQQVTYCFLYFSISTAAVLFAAD